MHQNDLFFNNPTINIKTTRLFYHNAAKKKEKEKTKKVTQRHTSNRNGSLRRFWSPRKVRFALFSFFSLSLSLRVLLILNMLMGYMFLYLLIYLNRLLKENYIPEDNNLPTYNRKKQHKQEVARVYYTPFIRSDLLSTKQTGKWARKPQRERGWKEAMTVTFQS